MLTVIAITLAGAIGSVVVARLAQVPAGVRRNDGVTCGCWEGLAVWARAQDLALERDIATKYEVVRAKGVHLGGAPAQSRNKATVLVEERYEEQRGSMQRALQELASSETLGYRLYRRLRRASLARFTAPDELSAILRRWRVRELPAL